MTAALVSSLGLKMDWVPNEASLGQVVELLKESHSPDTDTQRLVEQVSNHFYSETRQERLYSSFFMARHIVAWRDSV